MTKATELKKILDDLLAYEGLVDDYMVIYRASNGELIIRTHSDNPSELVGDVFIALVNVASNTERRIVE